MREMLFHRRGEEITEWALENPNTPHSTRCYWTMHDSKGMKRRSHREVFHEMEVENQKLIHKIAFSKRVNGLEDKQMETDRKRISGRTKFTTPEIQ